VRALASPVRSRAGAGLLCLLLALVAGDGLAPAAWPPPPGVPEFLEAAPGQPLPPPLARALGRLEAAALEAHIRFLASPPLAGRGLASEGLEAALEYVAAVLARAGVAPLPPPAPPHEAPPSFFQPVPLRAVHHPSGCLELRQLTGPSLRQQLFAPGVEVLLPEVAALDLEAPVVFAGHGIREPVLAHDDYAALPVRGCVVVVLDGTPEGPAWAAPAVRRRWVGDSAEERWEAKLEVAEELGAAALVGIELEQAWEEETPPSHFFLPADELPAGRPIPLVTASPAVAAFLAAAEPPVPSLADRAPGPLPGMTARLVAVGVEERVTSRNVLAVIPGSSEALRGEAVMIGAHVDHLGRVGGSVYPGADDNASGVAALLEIARLLAESPVKPRRSILLAAWTGEEEGKLGSDFYLRHPRWPVEKTVAYLNLDMIGHRFSPEEIRALVTASTCQCADRFLSHLDAARFLETGVARWAPHLDAVLQRAARGLGLALHLDRVDGRHGGSDYRGFARARVPFLRFFGNFFPGYHEPTDTPQGVDLEAVRQQAQLCLASAWLLADE
jgi:hypothetical protein